MDTKFILYYIMVVTYWLRLSNLIDKNQNFIPAKDQYFASIFICSTETNI